ncbi:MAG: chromatin protein Cren7 [Promethearchaeota archaeon]
MAKKLKCKNCNNTSFEGVTPLKTWQMFSPLPDKDGNITITVMGSFTCPNCGKNVRGAIKKIKADQTEGSTYAKREKLLETLIGATDKIDLKELSSTLDIEISTLKKVVEVYIKKGTVKGQVTANSFIPK